MNYQTMRDIIAVRPKALAFLAFLALLNLALFFYLSGYQRPRLAKAQTEWFAKREASSGRQTLSSAAHYRNGVRDLALFQKRLIAKKDFPAFLSKLFATGKSQSLNIAAVSYKPAAVKGAPGLLSYGLSFTVSGRYPGVKNFLAEVASYPEMVTMDSVSLSSSSRTEETVTLKVQLTAYLTTEGA